MRSSFSKAATIFFSPETLAPFVVGSIFLAVLGNSISQILANLFGTSLLASFSIGFGSLLIFLLTVRLFAQGLDKLEPRTLLNSRIPDPRRGLILLVSREKPCQVAIRHHLSTLEHCWLLHSSWDKSEAAVDSLMQEFSAQPGLRFEPILIQEIYDPLEYHHRIRKIYAQLPGGWSVNDVIADYTGMTASASVGMVLAALKIHAPLQYTPEDPQASQASMRPIEILLGQQSRRS